MFNIRKNVLILNGILAVKSATLFLYTDSQAKLKTNLKNSLKTWSLCQDNPFLILLIGDLMLNQKIGIVMTNPVSKEM